MVVGFERRLMVLGHPAFVSVKGCSQGKGPNEHEASRLEERVR
jgi:hypothetical protein